MCHACNQVLSTLRWHRSSTFEVAACTFAMSASQCARPAERDTRSRGRWHASALRSGRCEHSACAVASQVHWKGSAKCHAADGSNAKRKHKTPWDTNSDVIQTAGLMPNATSASGPALHPDRYRSPIVSALILHAAPRPDTGKTRQASFVTHHCWQTHRSNKAAVGLPITCLLPCVDPTVAKVRTSCRYDGSQDVEAKRCDHRAALCTRWPGRLFSRVATGPRGNRRGGHKRPGRERCCTANTLCKQGSGMAKPERQERGALRLEARAALPAV